MAKQNKAQVKCPECGVDVKVTKAGRVEQHYRIVFGLMSGTQALCPAGGWVLSKEAR